MRTLRLLLCVLMLTWLTACATCWTEPNSHANASEQQEKASPFFDWFTDQVISNLISWAL